MPVVSVHGRRHEPGNRCLHRTCARVCAPRNPPHRWEAMAGSRDVARFDSHQSLLVSSVRTIFFAVPVSGRRAQEHRLVSRPAVPPWAGYSEADPKTGQQKAVDALWRLRHHFERVKRQNGGRPIVEMGALPAGIPTGSGASDANPAEVGRRQGDRSRSNNRNSRVHSQPFWELR